jgi:hypothetical protein
MKFTYPSGSRPLDGYTIKRGIGQGGFGEVYYATSDAGKEVALKLIRRNLDVELRGVTQCLNLKHPSLLALYDIKVDERGDNWVVMEYVSGESLEDVLARHPDGLPLDEALVWFHGIAAGVAYLHDRGIVHRDLKPGNIFNDDGQVKIGDYGLSKFISASRRSGQTESVGTVHYMAPEIANGRYGKEIDLYALGVILYELLSGQVPFEGESVGEVLMKHLTAEPDVSRIPEAYRDLVARSLAKDPQQRSHSVAEFLAALPAAAARPALPLSLQPRPRPEPGLAETTVLASAPTPVREIPVATPVAAPPGYARNAPAAGKDLKGLERKFRDWWNPLETRTKVLIGLAGFGTISLLTRPDVFERGPGTVVRAAIILVLVIAGFRFIAWLTAKPDAAGQIANLGPAPAVAQVPPQPIGPVAPAPTTPVAVPARPVRYSRRQQRLARRESARRGLPPKSPCDKVTELLGSLLLAAAVSGAASLLMLIVQGRDTKVAHEYAWLALSATLGAWGVLIPAKLWEGRIGDVVLRRFAMLGIGLLFGLTAYESSKFMQVAIDNEVEMYHVPLDTKAAYNEEGRPEVMGYLAYFGFLFLLVRWWRQADPLRGSRLSLWSLLVCVFWSGALNVFWQFPQPWGMMMAGTISLAVQLASPWIDPQYRVARAASAPAATS